VVELPRGKAWTKAAIGLVAAVGVVAAFASPIGAALRDAKAKDACGLLTTPDVTAAFPGISIPAEPSPIPDASLTKVGKSTTGCAWGGSFDNSARVQPTASTQLDRSVNPKIVCKQAFTDASNRPLTKDELKGIGTFGTLFLPTSGSQARISICKGKDMFSVSVVPKVPITAEAMIGLARTAAKQV